MRPRTVLPAYSVLVRVRVHKRTRNYRTVYSHETALPVTVPRERDGTRLTVSRGRGALRERATHSGHSSQGQGAGPRGRAGGQRLAKGAKYYRQVIFNCSLSLSVTRSACHRCAFCGQYGGAEACTDCDRAQRAPAHQTTPVARRVALPGIPRPTPRAAHALRYSRGGWPS